MSKLARTALEDGYSGFEIMGDYRIKEKLYIAAEMGFEEKNTTNDYLDITTRGSYIKGGIDINLYDNWLDMDNMIYAGFRVGVGMKAELLNNLYLGLNVQLKISVNQTIPNNFDNVYIPGFGKTYDTSAIGAGYSYFLAYRIPLYKKDK